jgi:hypothetical protein
MVMTMQWQPRPSDVGWLAGTLKIIREGGIWGIPKTGQVFQISHAKKTLTLITDPGTKECLEMTEMTRATAAKLGWKVKTNDKTRPHRDH